MLGAAIACALEIQRAIAAAESGELPNRRISLRIGVNVGDVIVDGGDIYGDAVNIAARLQTYAEPGGIAVTGSVEAQIGADPLIRTVDLGNLYLHNMARPVRMFTLHVNGADVRLVGDAPLGADNRPSIAVLPFRKYQKDPEEHISPTVSSKTSSTRWPDSRSCSWSRAARRSVTAATRWTRGRSARRLGCATSCMARCDARPDGCGSQPS